jgi:hypothetical protein
VSKQRLTPLQRLDALAEQRLRDLEARVEAGEQVEARELNGVRRLLADAEDRRRQDAELERLNALTRS